MQCLVLLMRYAVKQRGYNSSVTVLPAFFFLCSLSYFFPSVLLAYCNFGNIAKK
jgi:hypothetical protein